MPASGYRRRTISATAAAAAALVALFALFEVHIRPEFALPRDVQRPDPQQEALYEQCVDRLTDQATRQAFEQADNPDVQNLMIRMRQEKAIDDCRGRYPERRVTINEPLRFNLVDVHWRFGKRTQR